MTQNDTGAPPLSNTTRCPDCGAPVAGGRAGCQSLFDELTVQAYHDRRYAALRDLVVDSYCMQHPETYCRSAKSYAAHLTRLCCGLEFGGKPNVYAAIQKWLSDPVSIERPATLSFRGQLTLLHVRATLVQVPGRSSGKRATTAGDAGVGAHGRAPASAVRPNPRMSSEPAPGVEAYRMRVRQWAASV